MPVEHLRQHQWKPGTSGNPAGAPSPKRALQALIRRRTNNGQELVDLALAMLRQTGKYQRRNVPERIKVQLIELLAEYGWGRPTPEPEPAQPTAHVTFVPLLAPAEPTPAKLPADVDAEWHAQRATKPTMTWTPPTNQDG